MPGCCRDTRGVRIVTYWAGQSSVRQLAGAIDTRGVRIATYWAGQSSVWQLAGAVETLEE